MVKGVVCEVKRSRTFLTKVNKSNFKTHKFKKVKILALKRSKLDLRKSEKSTFRTKGKSKKSKGPAK